jgi:hypothetical protein
MATACNELISALAGAIVGGTLTSLGAFALSKQTTAIQSHAVCEQLAMLMRNLEAKMIVRRDHDATPMGYEEDLRRLLDKTVSTEVAVAIPKPHMHRVYQAISNTENAVLSINYCKQMMETKNNPAYQQWIKNAADLACSELREARKLLGDQEKVEDPVAQDLTKQAG